MENIITSSEKAYRRILEAILENRLVKGEFLSQRMLAKIADTSIVSVREALKRLEHEHLIESIPKWGVRIPIETRERIIERYAVREALEVMASYLLAKNIKKADAAELYQKAKECDLMKTEDDDSVRKFADLHREFHLFLAECTGNKLLKTELERLRLRSLIYQSAKTTWYQEVDNWEYWHRSLVEEILSGGTNRAQEAMHKHIQHGLYHDLKMFDQGFYE